jgi:hypothetical protein
MIKNALSLFLILFLTGCTMYKVDSQDTASEFYPPKDSSQNISYMEDVTQPHEVIGTVTVNAERRQYMSEIIERMTREAAILGGDAITNIRSDASGDWKKLPAQQVIGKAYVRANFMADVVAFK